MKVIGTVWLSSASLVPHIFIKAGKIITAEKYCTEIDEMYQKLTCKQPALVNRNGSFLFHYKARPHVLMISRQKLHMLYYEVLDHPPYSPELTPTNFHFC